MRRLPPVLFVLLALSTIQARGQLRFEPGSDPLAGNVARVGAPSPLTGADVATASSPRRVSVPVLTPAGPGHKSPFLAWFLSWMMPGGGQAYNGQWGKSAIFFGGAVAGLSLAIANDGFDCSGDCSGRDAGLVVLLAASLGSQIDAPISASRINRKARESGALQVGLVRLQF